MKRVIKFRGLSEKTKTWVYGYFITSKGHSCIKADMKSPGIHVIPKTVGQFTGFKDINSVEVYEDDILENRVATGFICVFVNGGFCHVSDGGCHSLSPVNIITNGWKVTGNAHQDLESPSAKYRSWDEADGLHRDFDSMEYGAAPGSDADAIMKSSSIVDINGKELYSADIFDIGQTVNGRSKFVLMSCTGGYDIRYAYDLSVKYEYDCADLLTTEFEILGNIHENPEILEGASK